MSTSTAAVSGEFLMGVLISGFNRHIRHSPSLFHVSHAELELACKVRIVFEPVLGAHQYGSPRVRASRLRADKRAGPPIPPGDAWLPRRRPVGFRPPPGLCGLLRNDLSPVERRCGPFLTRPDQHRQIVAGQPVFVDGNVGGRDHFHRSTAWPGLGRYPSQACVRGDVC